MYVSTVDTTIRPLHSPVDISGQYAYHIRVGGIPPRVQPLKKEPKVADETTPAVEKKTISILDIEFQVSMPYLAGHTINEAEAKVLNQTRRENLGNNMRSKVKAHVDGEEGALTLEELQAAFAEADANYEFTLANVAASRKYTPEEREARKVARDYIRQKLDEAGQKIGTPPEGYDEKTWAEALEQEVDRISQDPAVIKIAKETIKARSKTTSLQLGLFGGTGNDGEAEQATA